MANRPDRGRRPAGGAPRQRAASRESERGAPTRDPARRAAFDLLRAVDADDAYANLVLPKLITAAGLSGRDAGLATELGYGTLRAAGTLDAIVARCVDRPLVEVEAGVRDLLRLGAYQLLRTRIPRHAAVASTVDLARATGHGRASGFVNAVLRGVAGHDWDGWAGVLTEGMTSREALAVRTAHPTWIVDAFAAALRADLAGTGLADTPEPAGTSEPADTDPHALAELEAALAADDARPRTHLIAWPGRATRDELLATVDGEPGPYSPYAIRMNGGDPAALTAVRERRAGVQDEGSQVCALALVNAPIEGRDERWLDLCAGPGGKAALLGALAATRGATLTANERRGHRADLVRRVTAPWHVEVRVGDAREITDGDWDRVLLDAPCSGLGALRRRPEARWRRRSDDLVELTALQRELLGAALRLVRPGGIVAYVTCSPHPAETLEVVAGHELIDARPMFAGVPDLGAGPTVQLWPHRHGTDAMFCALLPRR